MDAAAEVIIHNYGDEVEFWAHAYANNALFTATTWNGECTMPALALAIETHETWFPTILDVLVVLSGVDVNAPYIIAEPRGRIRTNALSQLLLRRDPTSPADPGTVLASLLNVGADPNTELLYDFIDTGAEGFIEDWRARSLLAFVMGPACQPPMPFYAVASLLRAGARFGEADPPGLFVAATRHMNPNYYTMTRWAARLMHTLEVPELTARGAELSAMVRSIDPVSGLSALHFYVLHNRLGTVPEIAARLRILRDAYGCSLMQETRTPSSVFDLASTDAMRAAVAEVYDEELGPKLRSLSIARKSIGGLPPELGDRIGHFAGLPMKQAHGALLHLAKLKAQRAAEAEANKNHNTNNIEPF